MSPFCSFVVCALPPSVLLCGILRKDSHEIVSLDCTSSSPTEYGTPVFVTSEVRATCFAKFGDKQFLVITNDEGVCVYDIPAGTREWQINNKLPGFEKDTSLCGVTSDELGHVFACDENNNCLQIFTIEGFHIGAVFFGDNVGTPRCVIYCKKMKNFVVFHDTYEMSNSVTVVNIAI